MTSRESACWCLDGRFKRIDGRHWREVKKREMAAMSDLESTNDAWRQLRSCLESLKRAGLMDLPVGEWSGMAVAESGFDTDQAEAEAASAELLPEKANAERPVSAEAQNREAENRSRTELNQKPDQLQKTRDEQRTSGFLIRA